MSEIGPGVGPGRCDHTQPLRTYRRHQARRRLWVSSATYAVAEGVGLALRAVVRMEVAQRAFLARVDRRALALELELALAGGGVGGGGRGGHEEAEGEGERPDHGGEAGAEAERSGAGGIGWQPDWVRRSQIG